MRRICAILFVAGLLLGTTSPCISASSQFDSSALAFEDITTLKSSTGIPIGAVIPWPAETMPSEGEWFDCHGQTYNTKDYNELFAAIKSDKVPDYRGVFLRGNDDGRGLDVSRKLGTFQTDSMGKQTLRGFYALENSSVLINADPKYTQTQTFNYLGWSNGWNSGVMNSIYVGDGDEVRPANVTTRYLIRAR